MKPSTSRNFLRDSFSTQLLFRLPLAAIFFAPCLVTTAARADQLPQLANYFGDKITLVERTIDNYDKTTPPEAFVFQDMNIDIAPQVSFGLNSFISLTVAPEIDFVLTPP